MKSLSITQVLRIAGIFLLTLWSMPAASSEPYPVVIDCTKSFNFEIPTVLKPKMCAEVVEGDIPYLKVSAITSTVSQTSIHFIFNEVDTTAYYNIYVVAVPGEEQLPCLMRVAPNYFDDKQGSFTNTYHYFDNPHPIQKDENIPYTSLVKDQCFVPQPEKVDTMLLQSGFKPTSPVTKLDFYSYGPVSASYRETIYTRTLRLHKIVMIPYASAEEAAKHEEDIPDVFEQIYPQMLDGLYYRYHDDGTCAVINGPEQYEGDIVIPSEIAHEGTTYAVTAIEHLAFRNCVEMTSVSIPSSIKEVGALAFGECTGLKSLSINGASTVVSRYAFKGTTNVEKLTINLSTITSTFSGFTNLQTLVLGDSVKAVHDYTFDSVKNYEKLTNIVFNKNLERIGVEAFDGCSQLDSVALGPNLKFIGRDAFYHCYSLKAVSIEATVPPELGMSLDDSPFFLSNSPILYVPEGRAPYYRAAKGWRDFSKIIAPDDSGEEESIPYPTIAMNKVWDTHYTFNDGTKKNKRYIVGDLCIINDKICGMVFARERYLSALNSILKESFDYSQTDTLYYYQEDDKVYCLAKDGSTETLMFDYGLKVGDVFVNSNDEQFHVIETDFFEEYENHFMQLADSVPPRTLRLRSDDGAQEQVWIEGFGETQCGIVPLYMVEKLKKINSRPTHSITPNNYFNGGYIGLNDGMFDVNDDDYKLIHFVPVEDKEGRSDLKYTFVGDTLCVTGNFDMQNYNTATCFECMITEDNTIAFNIWPYNRVPITGDFRVYVDVKIPGFKAGTYLIDGQTLVCEGNNPDGDYHPFIEDGKVWKLGWLTWEDTPAHELKYYFFGGDTIVNEVKGTRLMCQEMSKEEKNTYYVGSVREDDRVVYFTPADRSQEYVLYDFSAEVGDTLDIYCKEVGSTLSCIIDEKNTKTTYNGRQNRYVDIRVKLDDLPDEVDDYNFIDRWYEGIGRNGELENGPSVYPTGMYGYSIINCTVGNDTIWNSASTEDVTQYWSDEDNETKKQKIDFTHVIKTKPTSPRVAANISLVEGEYDNAVLCIDFEGMNGRYKINVRKDGEQQDRFSANQETHNLQSLDVNLAGYPDGNYTVVVENDGESFTAHFALPLDGTGIESIVNSQSSNTKSIYDLSGRRVINPKRGLYIQGNKMIIKQ